MDKIIALCKRRGFVFPGSEIYGGLASTYDYGPLGVELKNNIKREWWKYFVQDRPDMVGIDGGIIQSPRIWEASGHVQNFKDPLVECKKCRHRFRPDKLSDPSKCPDCGGQLGEARLFNGMFQTVIGPVAEDGVTAYLRPETAQAIFSNYKNVLASTGRRPPFGVGQIGKAFRNEITTGNFIFRTIEFEQMEIEYFIPPDADWNAVFESWVAYMYAFMPLIGLAPEKMYNHEIPDGERAFYSKRTIDMEYEFPFGRDELWAIANRTDYDLSRHQQASGVSMEFFDDKANRRYIPHVIEPTFGVDRTLLAVLGSAFTEEADEKGAVRTFLKLHPRVAPYKVAVAPLLGNKENLAAKAREVHALLKKKYHCAWDDRGNIGKRYRAQDEIGTPYFVVVDFDSLEDGAVTVRDRDTMKQDRVKITELPAWLDNRLEAVLS